MMTINRISELIVHYGSGPCLTWIALQGKEEMNLGLMCSIGSQLFWTTVFPLTIKRCFAVERNVWQAQLIGFSAGWLMTYFVAKSCLQMLESKKSPLTQMNEKADAVAKVWYKDLSIFFNPGKLFASTISAVLSSNQSKLEDLVFKATVIPCLVAVISHLTQRVSGHIQVQILFPQTNTP